MKQSTRSTITTVEQFAEYATQHGCVLSDPQIECINTLAQWLAQRAPPLGLSRYRDVPAVLTAALSPTLALFDLMDTTNIHQVMDLGAGSGALGFTMALLHPHLAVDLVERSTKAATFLELTAQHLNLPNVRVLTGDAQHLPALYAQNYDLVCFRAVATAEPALKLAAPFLKPHGRIAAWHQADDTAFQRPALPLRRLSTAQSILPGLVVSLYALTAQP